MSSFMADSSKSNSGGGCLEKLFWIVFLVVFCGVATALFFVTQPQDLSDIGGYNRTARRAAPRDLTAVLTSALQRGYSVTLSEAEINQWLGQTLAAKQGGLLAGKVSLDHVWVRLNDGIAEVIMERTVMGRPLTTSMFVKIEQSQGLRGVQTEVQRHGGPYHGDFPRPLRGGRFGKLVVPQGFLILVMPAYARLAELYREEIRLAFEEMARIRIEPKRLVLHAREPADASMDGSASF